MTVNGIFGDEVEKAVALGRRRQFVLTVLGPLGSYPNVCLRLRDSLYAASERLVYTVVPFEEPNEHGFSEIGWANVGEIRFWGALALSLEEGKGFYSFYPMESRLLCGTGRAENLILKTAERCRAQHQPQECELHWVIPSEETIAALYGALLQADNVLLRGMSCYLKAHMLWKHHVFTEEMGIVLHISLEAGLTVLRRGLSAAAGRQVSFDDVYGFVADTFSHGDALAEFWLERRDDRNMLIHPDAQLGSYVMHPMLADDVFELLDPMVSLYRYILIGVPRPVFDIPNFDATE